MTRRVDIATAVCLPPRGSSVQVVRMQRQFWDNRDQSRMPPELGTMGQGHRI